MNANEQEQAFEAVVGAAYEVANVLGAGFLEKVYERALVRELSRSNPDRGRVRQGDYPSRWTAVCSN